MPSVIGEPQLQPVCRTVGTPSSRAERASAIVCSNGSRPTSVSATPIVTSASSREQLALADPPRVGEPLVVLGEAAARRAGAG